MIPTLRDELVLSSWRNRDKFAGKTNGNLPSKGTKPMLRLVRKLEFDASRIIIISDNMEMENSTKIK